MIEKIKMAGLKKYKPTTGTSERGENEIMPLDKNNEFNNIVVYLLVGMSGIVLTLIGIIYNTVKKSVDKLFEKVNKNSEEISGINARCKERKHNDK